MPNLNAVAERNLQVESSVASESKHNKPEKHSLYHAPVNFDDGKCDGYERHMRRGSAVRSTFGYLIAILEKHPNPLNYVFPGKRRIQEQTFRWVRISRKKWIKSEEHYSRSQIYLALQTLEVIGAITPSDKGWIIHRHGVWTKIENGACRLRNLVNAPTFPKNVRTRETVVVEAVERRKARKARL
jgi:hypothetical protein